MDPQAVRKLCETHWFGTLNCAVTDEGELTIWSHDNFEVYEAWENGLPDYDGGIVTYEFLRELADHLEVDEKLDRWVRTCGEVYFRAKIGGPSRSGQVLT